MKFSDPEQEIRKALYLGHHSALGTITTEYMSVLLSAVNARLCIPIGEKPLDSEIVELPAKLILWYLAALYHGRLTGKVLPAEPFESILLKDFIQYINEISTS